MKGQLEPWSEPFCMCFNFNGSIKSVFLSKSLALPGAALQKRSLILLLNLSIQPDWWGWHVVNCVTYEVCISTLLDLCLYNQFDEVDTVSLMSHKICVSVSAVELVSGGSATNGLTTACLKHIRLSSPFDTSSWT